MVVIASIGVGKIMQELSVTDIVEELKQDNLLPAILFRTARRQCDLDIQRLATWRSVKLSREEQVRIKSEIDQICQKYRFMPSVIESHVHYQALVETGAGAHHAGQLLMWRLMLEELMTRGLLRVMIATGTVAAGVDFPARSVVISAHSKRGAEGFREATAAEFQQMSGRAGRRGKDSVGFCIVAPGRTSDARVIYKVSKRPPEPLTSAYFAGPSTVLNMLRYRSADEMRFTVEKSLASFLDRKAAAKMRAEAEQRVKLDGDVRPADRKKSEKRLRRELRQAEDLEQRQVRELELSVQGLTKLEHIQSGKLTPKGLWAANLCSNLVLELAEAIDQKLFDDVTILELIGLVASISGDPHRAYLNLGQNPIKRDYFGKLQAVIEHVHACYVKPHLSSEIKVLPEAALTVVTWYEAQSWQEFSGLLRLGHVAEGDAARLVTQTAEQLNQLGKLKDSHPYIAGLAEQGRKAILRPPLGEDII